MERMLEECKEEEPLPKEEIRDQDFDARRNHFLYQEKEAQKQADRLTERLRSYDENLTALAEYSDFPLGEEVEWEQDLFCLNRMKMRRNILVQGLLPETCMTL